MRASRSSTDEFLKKEYLVNKNIVNLINDIFWHMPFKHPTHADRVIMLIMFIIHIMTKIIIIRIMGIIRVAEQACRHYLGVGTLHGYP